MKYKSSKYNIKVNDNTIYNTWHCKFVTTQYTNELCDSTYIWITIPEELKRERFIVPEMLDETGTMLSRVEKIRQEEKPKYVQYTICTTMKCNMSCEYCFEKEKGNYTLTEKQEGLILDYIQREITNNENLNFIEIRWFGGEPLLNIDSIERISRTLISICAEKGIKYNAFMYSNVLLLTEDLSQWLYEECNVRKVVISVDGFEERYNRIRHTEKGTLEKVIRNIETAKQEISCHLQVDKENVDEIFRLCDYLKERIKKDNVNYQVYSIRGTEKSLTDKEYVEIRERFNEKQGIVTLYEKNRIGCAYCQRKSVIFVADGYLYRCDNHIGDNIRAIGTLEQGLYEESKITGQFIKNIFRREECRDCAYLPKCVGTCYDNYVNGKIPCDMVREMKKKE